MTTIDFQERVMLRGDLLDREAAWRRLGYGSLKTLDKVRERSAEGTARCRHTVTAAERAENAEARRNGAREPFPVGPCVFPEPDLVVAGRTPLWKRETIDEFGARHPRRPRASAA
jgi:hypothetical protein